MKEAVCHSVINNISEWMLAVFTAERLIPCWQITKLTMYFLLLGINIVSPEFSNNYATKTTTPSEDK